MPIHFGRKVGITVGGREIVELRRQSEQRLGNKEGSMCRKVQPTSVSLQLEGTDGEGGCRSPAGQSKEHSLGFSLRR